jgi:hypothetical protein
VGAAVLGCFIGALLLPVVVFFLVVGGWWPLGRGLTALLIVGAVIVAYLSDRSLSS